MSTIQHHVDQTFIARQLAESSNARALAARDLLAAKLRRLYETDHDLAAASAYAVDEATAIALRGLFERPEPISTEGDGFLIDRLLLHADPDIFAGSSYPPLAAHRAALATAPPTTPEAIPSPSAVAAPLAGDASTSAVAAEVEVEQSAPLALEDPLSSGDSSSSDSDSESETDDSSQASDADGQYDEE